MLGLEDQGFVTLAGELERGHEPGDAATDDDDALGRLRTRIEALGRDGQHVERNRSAGERIGLAGLEPAFQAAVAGC